ncbi:MAG TPA: helix-turn-helix domain-containing protein [Thermoleophilaceae bacterium]
MPYRPFDDQNCSIAASLAVLGERWTLLIMREVLLGRRRFEDIRRNTGIATNILSDRLQTLVDHGLLRHRSRPEHPELLEYAPTRKGVDVSPVLGALMDWGDRYAAPEGPPRVVVHTACGHDAHPIRICSHCGEPLKVGETVSRPGPGADERQRAEGALPVAR